MRPRAGAVRGRGRVDAAERSGATAGQVRGHVGADERGRGKVLAAGVSALSGVAQRRAARGVDQRVARHAVRVRVAARRDVCVRACGRTIGRGEMRRCASAAGRSRPERGGVARVRGRRDGQAARARGGEEACAPGAARAGTRVGRKEKEGRGKEERKEKGKNIGKEKKKRRGRLRKKRERGVGFASRSWRRSATRGAGRALVDRRDAWDEGHSEM